MVTERYCECLISQKPLGINLVRTAVLAVLLAASVVIGLAFYPLACIAGVLFGVLLWFSWQNTRVEYEYLVLDREISVDAVYGRSRRRKKMVCPFKKVVLFAPETSPEFLTYQDQGLALHDFSTRREQDVHFAMVCRNENGTIGFRLTPNGEMLAQLEYELPPGVFQQNK